MEASDPRGDRQLDFNEDNRMTKEEVSALEASGTPLEKIPGKLVATRKAPLGRRRARIVACGNFIHGDPLMQILMLLQEVWME